MCACPMRLDAADLGSFNDLSVDETLRGRRADTSSQVPVELCVLISRWVR